MGLMSHVTSVAQYQPAHLHSFVRSFSVGFSHTWFPGLISGSVAQNQTVLMQSLA
ncbi:hypothetical protein DPMN_106674 [Dreissena polymorpha]|uniref:Uncharacterized protein n=1 Tax=Dreissena polymorpha TaxID=45954 RepID=A0A9D4K5M9_DREPO|nr:hypothetical protein DPMN_106674 [Dreissena polymorpha]